MWALPLIRRKCSQVSSLECRLLHDRIEQFHHFLRLRSSCHGPFHAFFNGIDWARAVCSIAASVFSDALNSYWHPLSFRVLVPHQSFGRRYREENFRIFVRRLEAIGTCNGNGLTQLRAVRYYEFRLVSEFARVSRKIDEQSDIGTCP